MKQDEEEAEEEAEEADGKVDSKIRLQNVLLDETQMRTLEEMPGPQLVKTRSIVLDTCRVDDGLLPRLATWVAPMEGLQSLSLPNNRVGDQGVGRLLQLLRELPGVRRLNLDYNLITWKGCAAIAERLRTHELKLTHLSLVGNPLGHGIYELTFALQQCTALQSLSFGALRLDSSSNYSSSPNNASPSILSPPTPLSFVAIRELSLVSCGLGDEAAEHLVAGLKGSSTLQTLRLSAARLSAASWQQLLESLGGCPALEHLNAAQNNHLDVPALSALLSRSSSLRHLDLSSCTLGDRGLSLLSRSLRSNCSLTNLDLSCNQVGFSGTSSLSQLLRALAHHPSIRHILLSDNVVGPVGLLAVLRSRVLRRLHLLDLSACTITDHYCPSLNRVLAASPSLASLALSKNELGPKFASSMLGSLSQHPHHCHLLLDHNPLPSQFSPLFALLRQESGSRDKLGNCPLHHAASMQNAHPEEGASLFLKLLLHSPLSLSLSLSPNHAGASPLALLPSHSPAHLWTDPSSLSLPLAGLSLTDEDALLLHRLPALASATEIDLQSNPMITSVPPSLALLDVSRVASLRLDSHLLLSSRLSASSDPRAIITYAQAYRDALDFPLHRIKALVIGPPGSGKTLLAHRLCGVHSSCITPSRTSSTPTKSSTCPSASGSASTSSSTPSQPSSNDPLLLHRFTVQDDQVELFDLPGAAAQFHYPAFLSDHALVLVVFDLSQSTAPVAEILHKLLSRGGKWAFFHVFLVGTHADRLPPDACPQDIFDPLLSQLSDSLHDVSAIRSYSVSLSKESSAHGPLLGLAEDLAAAASQAQPQGPLFVHRLISELSHLQLSPPVLQWCDFRREVERLAPGQGPAIRLKELAVCLQQLGVAFPIGDQGQPRCLLLSPKWLLQSLLRLSRRCTEPIFDASACWPSSPPPAAPSIELLHELMVEREMLFRVSGPQSLFPDLLPRCPFAQPGNPQSEIVRLFELEGRDPLPFGVFPRLLARFLDFSVSLEVWSDRYLGLHHGDLVSLRVGFRNGHPFVRFGISAGMSAQTRPGWMLRHASHLRFFCFIISNVLLEYYHLPFKTLIPCPSGGCSVDLDDVAQSIALRAAFVSCKSSAHKTRIEHLCPELLWHDLKQSELLLNWAKDLEFSIHSRVLGRGAFGFVFTAGLKQATKTSKPFDDRSFFHSERQSSSSSSSSPSHKPEAEHLQLKPSLDSIVRNIPIARSFAGVSDPDSVVQVAIKTLAILDGFGETASTNTISSRPFHEFQKEVWLMTMISHPNIVKLMGVCLDPVAICMELVEGGSLYANLSDPLGVSSALSKLAQYVLQAVASHDIRRLKKHGNAAVLTSKKFAQHLMFSPQWRSFQKHTHSFHQQMPGPFCSQIVSHKAVLEQTILQYAQGPRTRDVFLRLQEEQDHLEQLVNLSLEHTAPLRWAVRIKLAIDLCSALNYLHTLSPPIIHRDLKSLNVLLTRSFVQLALISDTDVFATPLTKLSDFGLSVKLFAESLRVQKGSQSLMDGINPTWSAPEVICGEPYTAQSDIYSFGLVLWEILTRKHPFKEEVRADTQIPSFIQSGGRPHLPVDPLFPEFSEIVSACWAQDPSERPPLSHTLARLLSLVPRFSIPSIVSAPSTAPQVHPVAVAQASSQLKYDSLVLRFPPLTRIASPEAANGKCSSCDAALTLLFSALVCTSCRKKFCKFCIPSSRTGRMCFACACAAQEAKLEVQRASVMRIHSLCCVGNGLAWTGCRNGLIQVAHCSPGAPTPLVQVESSCLPLLPVQSVEAILLHRDTVWTGSADGWLHVWPKLPRTRREIRESARCGDWFRIGHSSAFPNRRWVALEGSALLICSHPSQGTPEQVLHIGPDLVNVVLREADQLLLFCGRKGLYTLSAVSGTSHPQVLLWYRMLALALSCSLSGSVDAVVIHPLAQFQITPPTQVSSLIAVDDLVWSASTDLILRSWTLQPISSPDGQCLTYPLQPAPVSQIFLTPLLDDLLPASPRINCALAVSPRVMWFNIGPNLVVLDLALEKASTLFRGRRDDITSLIAVGPLIWAATIEGVILVFCPQQRQLLHSFTTKATVLSLCALPDLVPPQVWMGDRLGHIHVYSSQDYSLIESFRRHQSAVSAMSSVKSRVFSASWDETIGCTFLESYLDC